MEQLLMGDCMELMSDISDGSVDMILCDLPYGRTRNKWDKQLPLSELWSAYKRIVKENGVIALFADGIFMANLMESNPKMWRYNLIWNKVHPSGFLNANRQPLRSHEEIVIFYKKQPTYNPQRTDGSRNHSTGKTNKLNMNNYNGTQRVDNAELLGSKKCPHSIITVQKVHPSMMIHPTQKPIELLEWLIKTYTNEGDTILDNCMGSGSTGIACKNTGRNFIGIEIDPEYYRIAVERIKAS